MTHESAQPIGGSLARLAGALLVVQIATLINHVSLAIAFQPDISLLSFEGLMTSFLIATMPFAVLWGGSLLLTSRVGSGNCAAARPLRNALMRKKLVLSALAVVGIVSTLTGLAASDPADSALIVIAWGLALVGWSIVGLRPGLVIDLACGFHHRRMVRTANGSLLCCNCRYDVSHATSDRCSECGEAIEPERAVRRLREGVLSIVRAAVTLSVAGLLALWLLGALIVGEVYGGSMFHVCAGVVGIGLVLGVFARSRAPLVVWWILGMAFVVLYPLARWDERAVLALVSTVEPGMTRAEVNELYDARVRRLGPPNWQTGSGGREVLEIEV